MKNTINLYQPSCYPKREKVTFKQFFIFASVCLLWLILTPFFTNQGINNAKQKLQVQEARLTSKQDELNRLVVELQKNRAPESKIRAQFALQTEIEAKRQLLSSLGEIEIEVIRFSDLMKGLSIANTEEVSIDNFSMVDGRLNISGFAKQGDSVPLWLSKIQNTDELLNIAFEQLNISEDSQGFTFLLSNKTEKKSVNKAMK